MQTSIASPAGWFVGSWRWDGEEQGSLGCPEGWLPLLGQEPGSRQCCCVNPCLPSARLAVNGAGLMGLVRGLQLMCVVHAAPRGAAGRDYPGVCRWHSRVCALMGGGNGQVWSCPVGSCSDLRWSLLPV